MAEEAGKGEKIIGKRYTAEPSGKPDVILTVKTPTGVVEDRSRNQTIAAAIKAGTIKPGGSSGSSGSSTG